MSRLRSYHVMQMTYPNRNARGSAEPGHRSEFSKETFSIFDPLFKFHATEILETSNPISN